MKPVAAPPAGLDRDDVGKAVETIKHAIGGLLDRGGYHLPDAQLALLLELSFKAGCVESIAQGDMDVRDVDALWRQEHERRRAAIAKFR